jgi:hypothetical protein
MQYLTKNYYRVLYCQDIVNKVGQTLKIKQFDEWYSVDVEKLRDSGEEGFLKYATYWG